MLPINLEQAVAPRPGSPLTDGFHAEDKDAFVAYDPALTAEVHGYLELLSRWMHAEVEGLQHVPRAGRALLVGNHAFGFDQAFAVHAIWEATRRPVFCLGEHLWWRVPVVRRLAAAIGIVDGTPQNVDHLLAQDQLVLVLPGGLRESVKPAELRYRLLWGTRHGFVRAAIRTQTPLIPVAAVGSDEWFDLAGDPFARGMKLLGRRFPLPLPKHLWSLPHRVRPRYLIGPPIPPIPVDQIDDPGAVHRLRQTIAGALHELIDQELARRSGFAL